MKLAIMQPYLFPYIGYFQLISAVNKFVFYDDVCYINKGWINRNNILVNGKATLFSVPLKNASQNRIIREIELVNDTNWKIRISKTIEFSYKKAPYFKDIFYLVNEVIYSKSTHINQLALLSIKIIAAYLQLETLFVDSSTVYNNYQLKAQDRIVDICTREKVDHYINPIGGMDMYKKDSFEEVGIKMNFLKSINQSYKQFNNQFVSSLSIIDVLMFNSKEMVTRMLMEYELV